MPNEQVITVENTTNGATATIKTGPLPEIAQPWINLFHTVGLPWFLVIMGVWYCVPFMSKMLKTQEQIDAKLDIGNKHMSTAIPLLERAVPLLEGMNRSGIRAAKAAEENHDEITELRKDL